MLNRRGQIVWWVVLLVYAGFLFYSSSQPVPENIPLSKYPYVDKIIHFVEYLVLFLILMQLLKGKGAHSYLMAISLSLVYGGFIEGYQGFIPQRSACIYDFIADTAGVLLGAWLRGIFVNLV